MWSCCSNAMLEAGGPSTSISITDPCEAALASCSRITKRMEDFLECDGLLMLHRSKWRCLARSYAVEIKSLMRGLGPQKSMLHRLAGPLHDTWPREQACSMFHKLAGPLEALEQAVQEGEACMHHYIIPRGNHHAWLVDKALKLAMSTDVVDVHLHHFLWVSSTVHLYLHHFLDVDFRHGGFRDRIEFMAGDHNVIQRTHELCKIWKKVDAKDDLRVAQDLLIKLKCKREKGAAETCRLVDFILCKLSHVEALQNHVKHDPLPPSYMCIDSDQSRPTTNTECLFKTEVTEIHKVMWLGRHFVLKSFKENFNSTKRQIFKREAAIQASVCHSHVLPLVCCTSDPPGLLMEHMKEDLHVLITNRKNLGKKPPFPLLMAVDLMLQIAKGMECLHTLRIVHRDLKSRNILVSFPVNSRVGDSRSVNPQVHLKIADFGVSKAKHDSSEYTTRGQGTTSWMAPEVYGGEGEPTRYSNKADVYSFGMVCSEILTGNPPFEGGEIRSRVAKGERPKLPPHCPTALSSLIKMCWDGEPNRRPNFTQICGTLCYFKACIFLQDCHVDWLSSPLISLQFSVDGLDLNQSSRLPDRDRTVGEKIRPLRIPLEMYYFGAEVHRSVLKYQALDMYYSRAEVHRSFVQKQGYTRLKI